MTFTSDERREVAENLRNLTIGRSIQYKEQFFDELAEVVVGFEDYHDFNVVLEKLADLIDRPTCCNVYDEIYDEYEGAVVKTASSAASAERSSRIARATASRGRSITARSAGERW